MEVDPRVQKQQRQAALAILLRVIERQPTGKKMDADDIRSQLSLPSYHPSRPSWAMLSA